MLTIAVVDDEERIRLGLGKLIRDAGEPYRVVGTFASGQELLDRMHELQPDLVITDVKMPQMDGLQLMARVRELASGTKIAVLSGYNDFEYARTAMRQGAVEYLLKPVNIKELHQLLANVLEMVQKERSERRLESDDLVSFLLGPGENRVPEHLFEEVCARLDRQPLFRGYYAILLLQASSEVTPAALERLTTEWGEERRIVGCIDGRRAVILPVRPIEHAGIARERSVMLLQQLPAGTAAKAGISGVFSGSQWLPQAYEEALRSLEQAWYSRERRVCGAQGDGHGARRKPEERYRLVRLLDKQLFPALHGGDYARLPDLAGACLDEIAPLAPGWAELKEACAAIAAHGSEELEHRGISRDEVEWPHDPGRFEDWRAFAAALKAAVEKLVGMLEQVKTEHRAVETVKAYIQQHFIEELELQHLADLVYLTPSYLSKLFKTETGETITDYIISERIALAKRLLKEDRGLKTYKVGERVGYSDPAYFTKVFKKMTGKTPKEYRDFVR
ncbi:response regulator [Paenibacillus ihbetae]|uniref:DNA-binding response regulator n=1 Tax=Paenibacillus ihbetae TaxID=1870820 RepID=A0ABX3JRU0_9BACL|nr:response regulator [Paenibacillus ihbetae]OOC58640.1 DNA-binding response regulator [Paenibacillus ihbetae]